MSNPTLPARQAELVGALVTAGPPPAGFDRGPLLARTELALREAALRYDGRHTPRRRRLPHLRRAPGGVAVGLLGRVRLITRG